MGIRPQAESSKSLFSFYVSCLYLTAYGYNSLSFPVKLLFLSTLDVRINYKDFSRICQIKSLLCEIRTCLNGFFDMPNEISAWCICLTAMDLLINQSVSEAIYSLLKSERRKIKQAKIGWYEVWYFIIPLPMMIVRKMKTNSCIRKWPMVKYGTGYEIQMDRLKWYTFSNTRYVRKNACFFICKHTFSWVFPIYEKVYLYRYIGDGNQIFFVAPVYFFTW